ADPSEPAGEQAARVARVGDPAGAAPLRAHDEVTGRDADEGVELRMALDRKVIGPRPGQRDVAHVPAVAAGAGRVRFAVAPSVHPSNLADAFGVRDISAHP